MVRPLLAKLAISGTRSGDHYVGGSVAFLEAGGRHDFAVEGERLRAGRDDGFVVERHAQLSGRSGDGWVHRSGKVHHQFRGSGLANLSGEMHRYIAHEQASRILVECNRAAENARHESAEARERDQATAILQQEVRGKIVVGAANAGAGFAGCELAFHFVVAEFPAESVGSGADGAEGFEDFEQSNVFVAIAFENGQRIVGGVGVDGDALFFGSAIKEKRGGKENGGCERSGGADGTSP